MEYIRQRGAYVEMPLAQMVETYRADYPKGGRQDSNNVKTSTLAEGDFLADAARENG